MTNGGANSLTHSARGFTWGWEGRPPKGGFNKDQLGLFEHPLCVGCEKSAIVKAELADEVYL